MQHLTTIDEWRRFAQITREANSRVGLVSTMGALHAGHQSLVQRALDDGTTPLVTIFVNPRQFNDANDLAAYPNELEEDVARCRDWGAAAVVTPSVAEMWPNYPADTATTVHVAGVTEGYEGAGRPGHFDGVASVVTKIFAITGIANAYFGEKDFQQLAMVRRLNDELSLGLNVIGCPIVRDEQGLALSSRNVRLSADGRQRALAISRAVAWAGAEPRTVRDIEGHVDRIIRDAGGEVAYASVVNSDTVTPFGVGAGPARLVVAAYFEGVRLLDNGPVVVHGQE